MLNFYEILLSIIIKGITFISVIISVICLVCIIANRFKKIKKSSVTRKINIICLSLIILNLSFMMIMDTMMNKKLIINYSQEDLVEKSSNAVFEIGILDNKGRTRQKITTGKDGGVHNVITYKKNGDIKEELKYE